MSVEREMKEMQNDYNGMQNGTRRNQQQNNKIKGSLVNN